MDISLDQVRVFLAVVEDGSFSAAARTLGRGQSAITYTIQKLEAQIGKDLFDRANYRPALTEAGRALLPFARRIAEDVGAFGVQARSIAGGLETELTLAVDSMFPMPPLLDALKAFQERFPTVQPHLYVESLGSTVQLVLDGVCDIALAVTFATDPATVTRRPLTQVELAMVVAPGHPLARVNGPVSAEMLRDHVQLVLTDRSGITGKRDFGVSATRTWRLADLGAKHAMLKAGLGYGSMPMHMIDADLRDSNLVRIVPEEWDGKTGAPVLPICAIHRIGHPIGPATQWMMDHLAKVTREFRAQVIEPNRKMTAS